MQARSVTFVTMLLTWNMQLHEQKVPLVMLTK